MYRYLQTFAIGGLQNVGYADGTDNLIVLSMQGTGVFNCLTGEKTFRNEENWWNDFNELDNSIIGFGSEEGKTIKTYGLFGNENLPVDIANNWKLVVSDPEPDDSPFEKYMVQKINLIDPLGAETFVAKDGACELRTFGFSQSGRSFVIALSCELIIWTMVN